MSHHQPSINSGGIADDEDEPVIIHHCQVCPRQIPLLSSKCRECHLNTGFCPDCRNHQLCEFCNLLEDIFLLNISNQDNSKAIDEGILISDADHSEEGIYS